MNRTIAAKAITKLFDQSQDALLNPLPDDYLKSLPRTGQSSEDVALALLNRTTLDQDRKSSQYENRIEHRSMLLHPTTATSDSRAMKALIRKSRIDAKRKPRPLSAKEKRTLGLHRIPSEASNYGIYVPLHQLWNGYIREIVQTGGNEAKLLKADYHGAMLKVVKSSSPSMLFISGIVVKETRHTFVICTREDKIKTIPKRCTVFEFCAVLAASDESKKDEVMLWEVHGEHFGFRAAERVAKKFKGKHTVDL